MILAINPYLFIAIGVVVLLILIFFVTYFLNKKTPVPKGCENIKLSEEGCLACNNTDCSIRQKIDLKKLEDEIKEEE